MMRTLVLAALVVLSGCSAAVGPSPQEQEQAFIRDWDGALGMDRALRPSITWASECRSEFWGVSPQGYCFTQTLTDKGEATIEWKGSFRDSEWASTLVRWRDWLLFTAWHSSDDDAMIKLLVETSA